MTAGESLQSYIDSKIPTEMQENFADRIALIRGGWNAAMRYMEGRHDSTRPD